MFLEISVEELDWPAQSPDLNTIKSLPRKVEAVTAAKGRTNSILMHMILE